MTRRGFFDSIELDRKLLHSVLICERLRAREVLQEVPEYEETGINWLRERVRLFKDDYFIGTV